MSAPRSLSASAAGVLALAAIAAWLLAPVLARVARPMTGFGAFGVGLVLAVGALLLGVLGVVRTRGGRRGGRRAALTGIGTGLVALGVVGVSVVGADGAPRINDITTDPDEPPRFAKLAELEPNRSRDMRYDPSFAAIQRAAYPEVASIETPLDPAAAHQRALEAARIAGWQVVAEDAKAGRIEATDTSTLFRFVDDIVVRVRAGEPGGSVVDVRSKSRDGKGDLGVNARRIRAFAVAFAAAD